MFLTADIKYDIVVANSNKKYIFTPLFYDEVLITSLTAEELNQLGFEPIYPFGNYMIYRGEDDYYCASKRDFGNMPTLFVQYLKVLEAVVNLHRNEDKMFYGGMELDTVEKLLNSNDLTRILISNSDEELIDIFDNVNICDWTVTVNLVEQKVCHYCNKQLVHEDYYPDLDVLCRELNFSNATDWLVYTDDYYWNRDIFNFLDDLFSNADDYDYHSPATASKIHWKHDFSPSSDNFSAYSADYVLSKKTGTYYLFRFQPTYGPASLTFSLDDLVNRQITAFTCLERIWSSLFTEDGKIVPATIYKIEVTNIVDKRPFGKIEKFSYEFELESIVDELDNILLNM